jgi:hypothetical protein
MIPIEFPIWVKTTPCNTYSQSVVWPTCNIRDGGGQRHRNCHGATKNIITYDTKTRLYLDAKKVY